MTINFKEIQINKIEKSQIFDLYADVGWTNYLKNKETLLKRIKASLLILNSFDVR